MLKIKLHFLEKKIKFFDYAKYYKEASKHIHDVHDFCMSLKNRNFKSIEEMYECETEFYKKHEWDTSTDVTKYFFEMGVSNILPQIDRYAEDIIDTAQKISKNMIDAEEEIKKLAAEEAAREKTDSENISKNRLFKKIGNNLCQFGKKVSSYLPFVGYKTLEAVCRLGAIISMSDAIDSVKNNKLGKAAIKGFQVETNIKSANYLKDKANKSLPK